MPRLTTLLYDAQGGRCCYCQCLTWLPGRDSRKLACDRFGISMEEPGWKLRLEYRRATREHIVRKADGGGPEAANAAMACMYCNTVRQACPPNLHAENMRLAVRLGRHPNAPTKDQKRWAELLRQLSTKSESDSPSPPSSVNAST